MSIASTMLLRIFIYLNLSTVSILCLSTAEIEAEKSGWSFDPNIQYHVQTDEGPERYFRFQTLNGQYRKEKRLLDGTVIGTEGWLDPLGYLRLKDYIADSKGYRILRSKMIYVGKDKSTYDAVSEAKRHPPQTGLLLKPTRPPNPFRQLEAENDLPLLGNDINSDYYISTTAKPRIDLLPPEPTSNNDYYYNVNRGNTYNSFVQRTSEAPTSHYQRLKPNFQSSTIASRSSSTQFPEYDGTYSVGNGFQYYLKRHYHEEEQDSTGANVGSFGYIDPFGIRRVVYYKTNPQNGGFIHQKNNKYVGFAATPYDTTLPKSFRRDIRSAK